MSMMSKEKLKNYFSSMPKTFFIFTLVIICMTTAIFTLRKTITVTIDGQIKNITTLGSNLKNVLDDNGIALGEKDKISVNLNSKIKNGDKINIQRAVDIKISLDGQEKDIKTAEKTVEDMLVAENIKLNELDKISINPKQAITKGLNIKVTRVNEEVQEKKETIAFSKEVKKSDQYEVGTSKVLQEGECGEKVISTKVVYEDGKEVSRNILNEKITKNPINEILAVGTLKMVKLSRGSKMSYSRMLKVSATAYTADFNHSGVRDDPYAGRTASGTSARRNPNGYSTIAVDPSVIPLGTKVYIEGYGLAIAEDTGGAIKGNKIDLYMNRYSETTNWGRRYVNLYILN